MPEMYFDIRWPDGRQECCYSPSRIIEQYFAPGQRYSVQEFLDQSNKALNQAAERVRAKYGFYCSAAMDQLARLEATAAHLDTAMRAGQVEVVAVHEQPPCSAGNESEPVDV